MKLPKNYMLLASLLFSVLGLVLIYIATISIEPQIIAISDITADIEGRKIATTGYIIERKLHKDGHLFLTISDKDARIQVPLFSDYMKSLGQIGIAENDFHVKDKIFVEGMLENYKGTLQIVPKNLNSIKILGE